MTAYSPACGIGWHEKCNGHCDCWCHTWWFRAAFWLRRKVKR